MDKNAPTGLADITPDDFVAVLREKGARRAYWVWDPTTREVRCSHPFLQELAVQFRGDTVDYQGHEGIFLEVGEQSGALLGAFVHNSVRGQAAGGVRYWPYRALADFLYDGIRLAKGMTHKNALAGLWWGGGKGVIAHSKGVDHRDPDVRRRVYQDFGKLMTSLRGCYVTAEDAGTHTEDMLHVYEASRFTTCIPESVGGSGNPSIPTASGVLSAIEGALEHRGMGAIEGKTIAIQGIGNVGGPLARMLVEKGAKRVVGSDTDARREKSLAESTDRSRLDIRIVEPDDMRILAEEADVVAPCAHGATLNERTIPTIRAPIVCGAANNQLAIPAQDGPRLVERGITYVPDFLANRMGIVNCANEQYGYVPNDEAFNRHLGRDWDQSIYALTRKILANAERTGKATDVEAVALAEELAETAHPLWGHRGKAIIDALVLERWEAG
jgi:leucine dehydrogenase